MLKSDEILIGHIFDAARRAVAKVAKRRKTNSMLMTRCTWR